MDKIEIIYFDEFKFRSIEIKLKEVGVAKLAKVIFRKHLKLTELTFAVILNWRVIWYNPTYADTYSFKKLLKNTQFVFSNSIFTIFYYFSVSGSGKALQIMQKLFSFKISLSADKNSKKLKIKILKWSVWEAQANFRDF